MEVIATLSRNQWAGTSGAPMPRKKPTYPGLFSPLSVPSNPQTSGSGEPDGQTLTRNRDAEAVRTVEYQVFSANITFLDPTGWPSVTPDTWRSIQYPPFSNPNE